MSVPQEPVCGWETMVMNCGLCEFWTDQGACSSMSATLWSLPSVFMRRYFVFLTTNTSAYLPDVLLSAGMLFFHIVSQLFYTVEEWQHTYFAKVVCTKGLGRSSYHQSPHVMHRLTPCDVSFSGNTDPFFSLFPAVAAPGGCSVA